MQKVMGPTELENIKRIYLTMLRENGIFDICERCEYRHGYKCRRNDYKYIPHKAPKSSFRCMDYKLRRDGKPR